MDTHLNGCTSALLANNSPVLCRSIWASWRQSGIELWRITPSLKGLLVTVIGRLIGRSFRKRVKKRMESYPSLLKRYCPTLMNLHANRKSIPFIQFQIILFCSVCKWQFTAQKSFKLLYLRLSHSILLFFRALHWLELPLVLQEHWHAPVCYRGYIKVVATVQGACSTERRYRWYYTNATEPTAGGNSSLELTMIDPIYYSDG